MIERVESSEANRARRMERVEHDERARKYDECASRRAMDRVARDRWLPSATESDTLRAMSESNELVFHTNPMSRGRIARWMLEEVGVPYHTEVVGYGAPMRTPEYLAKNPMAKVPMLVRGDEVITECAAICAWLADAYPDAGLAPALGDRASYYRWLFFAAGPVEAAVTNRSMGWEVPPDKRGRVGYGDFASVMATLVVAVTRAPYLAGDRFSAADVYLGSQIGWGLQFGTMEKRPELEAYWARISDRDAYRRAKALDDALMPK